MQFSIRSLLLLFLVIAVICAYHVYTQPRRIPIAAEMFLDLGGEVPEFALLYRGWLPVRKTMLEWNTVAWRKSRKDPGFKERHRILKQDLNCFHEILEVRETDNAVAQIHKDDFVKLALSRLDDTRPFADVEAAYRVLCQLEHAEEAISYLTERYVKHFPADPKNLKDWPFAETPESDEDSKLFAKHEKFIAELVSLAESDDPVNPLLRRYFRLMAKAGRPDLGMKWLSLQINKQTHPSYASSIIRWANKNNASLSDEAAQFALSVCKSKGISTSQRLEIASLFLLMEDSHPDRAREVKDLIMEIHSSLPAGDTSALQALPVVPAEADFFRKLLSESKSPKEKLVLIKALKELGFDAEVAPAIVQLVESRKLDNELYLEYREIRGDAAVPFFKTRIDELIEKEEENFDLLTISSAFSELAELKRGTKDRETIDFLRGAFERILDVGGYYPYSRARCAVDALEIIGDEVHDLLKRLPESEYEVDAMAVHWRLHPDLRTQDLVAQLNEGFDLYRLLENEDFTGHENGDYWRVLELLEKTGGTKQIHIMEYSREDVAMMAYDICQLAKDELNLRAVVQNGFKLKIVLDNRQYVVPLTDSGVQFQSNMMVDILNAIMAREGETKRFFVYSSCDSTEFSYIVFVEPQVVRDLKEKFGMEAVQGYEYYLKH